MISVQMLIITIGTAIGFALMLGLIFHNLWSTRNVKPKQRISKNLCPMNTSGKNYFLDKESGRVHSPRVAAFMQEIEEVQRKHNLDINAGNDTLCIGELSPTYGHTIFSAIDETGTREEQDERDYLRYKLLPALDVIRQNYKG